MMIMAPLTILSQAGLASSIGTLIMESLLVEHLISLRLNHSCLGRLPSSEFARTRYGRSSCYPMSDEGSARQDFLTFPRKVTPLAEGLPGRQGIQELCLQARPLKCHVLSVAGQVCRPGRQRCEQAAPAGRGRPAVEAEGGRAIADIQTLKAVTANW